MLTMCTRICLTRWIPQTSQASNVMSWLVRKQPGWRTTLNGLIQRQASWSQLEQIFLTEHFTQWSVYIRIYSHLCLDGWLYIAFTSNESWILPRASFGNIAISHLANCLRSVSFASVSCPLRSRVNLSCTPASARWWPRPAPSRPSPSCCAGSRRRRTVSLYGAHQGTPPPQTPARAPGSLSSRTPQIMASCLCYRGGSWGGGSQCY